MGMDEKKGLQGRKIQQVRMQPQTHATIKQAAQNQDVEISEMYDKIISQYLNLIEKKSTSSEYFASPKNGVLTSIWIRKDIHERIKERSKTDGTSMNRVIFTAIRHFMNTV